MKANHKLVDCIAVTMLLYCVSSLVTLVLLCSIRAFFVMPIRDSLIAAVSIAAGFLVTSRSRVKALSDYLHKIFNLSY